MTPTRTNVSTSLRAGFPNILAGHNSLAKRYFSSLWNQKGLYVPFLWNYEAAFHKRKLYFYHSSIRKFQAIHSSFQTLKDIYRISEPLDVPACCISQKEN